MEGGVKLFHLVAQVVQQQIAPNKIIDVWGFNGSAPGPTFQVTQGDRIRVIVFGQDAISNSYAVSGTGHVSLPLTGDVTVGGVGRLQVLLATHFPGLYRRLGRPIAGLLFDPDRPKTDSNNLDAATAEGRERSLAETGRGFSLYGPVSRHPTLVATGAGVLGLAVFLGYRRVKRDA